MSLNELTITRGRDGDFKFVYSRNETAVEVSVERNDIVRFLDDAIDALMRGDNKLSCSQLSHGSPFYWMTLDSSLKKNGKYSGD